MAPSATGAKTSAVAVRHQSISRSLDPAPTPGPRREGLYGPQELLRREVRPQSLGNVELGVGYLPEQEVGHAQFAARPDHQVHLRHLRRVEVASEDRLVHLLGGETVRDYTLGGVHDLRPAAVVERHVDVEVIVARGEILSLAHGPEHRGGEVFAAPEEAEPGPAR